MGSEAYWGRSRTCEDISEGIKESQIYLFKKEPDLNCVPSLCKEPALGSGSY